ncbi:MAG TPA: RidA family protein [Gemmatimonadales bacterium]|jgi:2-iminobutanoate/2-iminopropanoate deaminase|nr:RidA family protein [Gemmatimonadales bacterium]
MKKILILSSLCVGLLVQGAAAQYGGGRREGGMGGYGRPEVEPAPPLPGAVMEGPPDSAAARSALALSDSQAARYTALYSAFMVATKPSRDSAQLATDKMNDRLATGDRAAALFYAQRLQDIGKSLRDRQDKFDDGLKAVFTKDQQKAYRKWEDDAERVAQERNKEAGLRWQEVGGFGAGHTPEDRRTLVESGAAPAAALGSQAVRVGRTIYVSAQTGQDSTGALAGTDLASQARQAFRNVTAILKRATASPNDVVRITVYALNPDSGALAAIRAAGADYFAGRTQPATVVVGVAALAKPGALVAIEATAVTGSGGY